MVGSIVLCMRRQYRARLRACYPDLAVKPPNYSSNIPNLNPILPVRRIAGLGCSIYVGTTEKEKKRCGLVLRSVLGVDRLFVPNSLQLLAPIGLAEVPRG